MSERAMTIKVQFPATVTGMDAIMLPKPVSLKAGVNYLLCVRGDKAVVVRNTQKNRDKFASGALP